MGIQILPEGQGGFAASFGQALGQGVNQQLPEEIKRYRVKSGLENIGKQNIQDPYQLVSQLATVPGLDPGLLGVLAPLLQSQIGRQQAGAGFGGGDQQSGFGQQPSSQSPTQQGNGGLNLTPQGQNAPTLEPINELATNLLRHQPFNYPNINAATAEAERRIQGLDKEFDRQTASFLQKGKELQEGEIGGDVLDLMRQKAVQDIARTGASERSIAQKYARQAKDIAQEYGAIRKVNSDTGNWKQAQPKTIKSLRDTNEKLANLGVPKDQIVDRNQADLGIGRGAASYLLDPLENSQAGKIAHRAKTNVGLQGAIQSVKSSFSNPEKKLAEEIAPVLNEKDLIGSLAYIVSQKGYDWKKFVTELQALRPTDTLTPPQSRDLANQELIPYRRPLKEQYLMGNSGESRNAGRNR